MKFVRSEEPAGYMAIRAARATAATVKRFREGRRVAIRRPTDFWLLFVTALVFLAPNAIFATGLRPAPAAIAILGCGALVAIFWRLPRIGAQLAAPIDLGGYGLCLVLGAALCLLGGEGHFFYTTTDWLFRDAVLADLVNNGLKVVYRHDGQDYLLRAPLGMYLFPATIGRALGLFAAHIALLAQNSFIVGSIAYFAMRLANVRRAPMLLLLFFFSGLDIAPVLLTEAIEMAKGAPFLPFGHIEWWGAYYSDMKLQYSSHITQLFWVPNHMAPGWWFAILSLLYARREIDLAALLVSFAAMLLWSPLAMMGAAPFLILFRVELLPRDLFAPRVFAAAGAGLCFLPVALYLTMDAGEVPHEWLIAREGFAWRYFPFLAVEIPQAAIVLYAWNKVEPPERRVLLLALVSLCVFPIYSVGPSNDFTMRASIAPLFLLAFAFARVAALTPRDNGVFPTIISMTVILSFATPMLEMKQALTHPYAISDCNLLTSWSKVDPSALPTNYWARVEKTPSWLLSTASRTPLTIEDRKCWPDHPLLQERMK